MYLPGRKYQATTSSQYRYSINGQEKENELNENITTAEYWEYDSRIGRRWNVDPVQKEYESPYAVFGNNPIWNIDPDGSDTAKYLNNSQLVSALKIANNEIKSRVTNKQGFGLQSKNFLPALNAATTAYASEHNLNAKEAFEFYNNVLADYNGLASVAMVSSEGFMKLDRAVINNKGVNNYNTLRLAQGYIYECDANLRGILNISANVALGEAAGAIGTAVGQGPRGTFQSSVGLSTTQRVGQWMSPGEYEMFNKTGTIPRTNVLTRGPAGYEKTANHGDFYVEFDVNRTLLRNKSSNGNGWALIKSKNQMEIKLAAKKGQTLAAPIGTNIKMIKSKQ